MATANPTIIARPDAAPPVDAAAVRRRLHRLVHTAAALDLGDAEAWSRIGREAQRTVATAIELGLLPASLAIRGREAAVVTSRTLAAAARLVGAPGSPGPPGR